MTQIVWLFLPSFRLSGKCLYYLCTMKVVLLIVSLVIVLTACNKPNKKIKERISGADSVAINYFKGDGTMDSVVKVKIIKDKKTLDELTALISASSAQPGVTCGYDGSLHFFKKNVVLQDVDFRMNDAACMFFTFKQEGKSEATVLSPEAKEILEKIMSK